MNDQHDNDALWQAAEVAARCAYTPYSQFAVGAALRASDGTIISGCNVENASFGLAMCAERVALGAAVAAGFNEFDRIAVFVDADDGSPCGACRQVLAEFGLDLEVEYVRAGARTTRPLRELLVDAFTPTALPRA